MGPSNSHPARHAQQHGVHSSSAPCTAAIQRTLAAPTTMPLSKRVHVHLEPAQPRNATQHSMHSMQVHLGGCRHQAQHQARVMAQLH